MDVDEPMTTQPQHLRDTGADNSGPQSFMIETFMNGVTYVNPGAARAEIWRGCRREDVLSGFRVVILYIFRGFYAANAEDPPRMLRRDDSMTHDA